MSEHPCRQEGRLGSIDEQLAGLWKKSDRLSEKVEGNGKPGLATVVHDHLVGHKWRDRMLALILVLGALNLLATLGGEAREWIGPVVRAVVRVLSVG